MKDIVPYDLASLLLLEGNTARVVRSHNLDIPPSENKEEVPEVINVLEVKSFSEIVQTHRPVIIKDIKDYPGWVDYLSLNSFHSWIGAPIIARDDLIGFLCLAISNAGFYKPEHSALLEAFAGQASLALQNSRLFETAQRKGKESETLRQAASAITRSLNLVEIIDIILEQLNFVIPYDSASVLLLQGNELEIVGGHGFPDPAEVLGLKFSLDGDNPCALVYSTHQPFILEDAPMLYQSFTESPHDHIHSWLGVPLIVQGRFTGMISLDSIKSGTFTPDHARLAVAYADQVAIALENARLFAQTQELAITDPLTGSYNRRFFFNQAKTEFERARRYQGPLSIIMLDIDDFKKINDTYGHLIGDQVLQSLAKLCKENVREIDVVGRYGGEEFVILLPETPLVIAPPASMETMNNSDEITINSGAVRAAERLRLKVAQDPIPTEKAVIQITISLGVAEYHPDIVSPEMLLDHADKALYLAKQAGKNRVAIFEKEISPTDH
jgi:diguanylate cyclase (GGDEF)-like protein